MSAEFAVLQHPEIDGQPRILVHIDALPEHVARGWVEVGPCSNRFRDPLLSDDEQTAADLASVTAIEPDPVDEPQAGDEPITIPDTATPADDTQEQ